MLRDLIGDGTMVDMKLSAASPITAAFLMVGFSVACQAPAAVDGVFSGEDFSLRCDSPLATGDDSGRDRVVVLSETTSETLSTVNVRLRNVAQLPLETEVDLGSDDDGLPSVQVVVGALIVETRADGVEVLSPADPVRAGSVTGALTLQSNTAEGVAGSFRADLDDGGYVEGFFDATMTR